MLFYIQSKKLVLLIWSYFKSATMLVFDLNY